MGDWTQADALASISTVSTRKTRCRKMILYNVNPGRQLYFATMIGNFQGGGIAGKMQFGSGWWFLDQKEGIEMQVNALSNVGLLSRFVGMLTDSRSFMSYPSHEYFRRVLCNMMGKDIEVGRDPRQWPGRTHGRRYLLRQRQRYFRLPGLEDAKSHVA